MDMYSQVVVFDAADLTEVSRFWAGVLDGSVDRRDDWHMVLDRDGKARIGAQLSPDHAPPQWPAGDQQQQQVHLDWWVTCM